MKESDFWDCLEYRICREMDDFKDCKRLGLWCDGFIPDQYVLDCSPSCITGRVWIGFGPRKQEQWQFKLMLYSAPVRLEDITWSELLPSDEVTEWLGVDIDQKRLEIRPRFAKPI